MTKTSRELFIASYWPGGKVGDDLTYEVATPCEADSGRCVRMRIDPNFWATILVVFEGKEITISEPTIWLAVPRIAAFGGALNGEHKRKLVDFWDGWRACSST